MHALTAAAAALALGADEPVLAPQKLYHAAAGGRVMLTVRAPSGADDLVLTLLDARGSAVAAARGVGPGRIDLAEQMPEIWMIRRACYLQCLRAGRPLGSALVVQPMLTPARPRTETVTSEEGGTSSRITGWATPEAAPPVFSGLRIYPARDVLLRTSLGDIVLTMCPEEAPNTVWNFLRLVEGGFYDGLAFHRIVPVTRDGEPFIVQAGDPAGNGEGGPGYRLPMEPSGLPHDFGVIAMARGDDPDSAGSQFFIGLSRAGTEQLDGQYCAFGYAIDGDETIRAIAAVELADVATGRPVDPPRIIRAELIEGPPRLPGMGRPDRSVAEVEQWEIETKPDRVPR